MKRPSDRQTAAFAGGPFLPPLSLCALYRPLYHTAQGQTARPVRYLKAGCGPSASFGLALVCRLTDVSAKRKR